MARPTQFDRQTSFALFSAENPGDPHSGADLDAEFNAVKISLDETQDNLALIQDDDGRLARGSVGRAQLDASITIGFEAPAAWSASTAYEADISTVFNASKFYIAVETHTSVDTFDATKWVEIADFTLQNTLNDGDVTTAKIADLAITTDKLNEEAVTTNKIADNAVSAGKILTGAVTTAKIADDAVTPAKVSSAIWGTGDVKLTLKTVADAGWVLFDDGTIGSASSTASTRANADCEDLFLFLWARFTNTWAPVTGGRGATAAADWAANKKIKILTTLGRAVGIAGAGSGLTSRTRGSTDGAETVTLAQANLPAVNLSSANLTAATTVANSTNVLRYGGIFVDVTSGGTKKGLNTDASQDTITATTNVGGTVPLGGSGTAIDNMPPIFFINAMVKL